MENESRDYLIGQLEMIRDTADGAKSYGKWSLRDRLRAVVGDANRLVIQLRAATGETQSK